MLPDACSSSPFPFDAFSLSAQDGVSQMLSKTLNLNSSEFSQLLNTPSVLSTLFCATDTALVCHGICPNADLAGIGVRIAFFLSSILQAVLVSISPEDSVQGTWSSVVLTASVIIPAITQKRQGALTVYHATLVLNFATFSSLVSLAIAPMCSVWRKGEPLPDFADQSLLSAVKRFDIPRQKVHQERMILSLALLLQVALQWTWAVILFTDPQFAQVACSPLTTVVLFGKPFQVTDINHRYFIVWPIWLLFNVSITLTWGILLVFNSGPSVHPLLSRAPSFQQGPGRSRRKFALDWGRVLVLTVNTVAFFLGALFVISSEIQSATNCIRGGENSSWSFGQIAALLVALIPLWPISSVLHRKLTKHQGPSINIDIQDISQNLQSAGDFTPFISSQADDISALDLALCIRRDAHSQEGLLEATPHP